MYVTVFAFFTYLLSLANKRLGKETVTITVAEVYPTSHLWGQSDLGFSVCSTQLVLCNLCLCVVRARRHKRLAPLHLAQPHTPHPVTTDHTTTNAD